MKQALPNLESSEITRAYGSMSFVSDIKRSVDFYSKLLGRSPSYEKDNWIEFDLGDFNLCLCPTNKALGKTIQTRIILEVQDLASLKEKLSQNQIQIVEDIQNIKDAPGQFMNIEDPDGNVIGLYAVEVD